MSFSTMLLHTQILEQKYLGYHYVVVYNYSFHGSFTEHCKMATSLMNCTLGGGLIQ